MSRKIIPPTEQPNKDQRQPCTNDEFAQLLEGLPIEALWDILYFVRSLAEPVQKGGLCNDQQVDRAAFI